ncbi:MAG: SURF1 family protein [Pseudomonadota bacterium]
MQRILIPLLFGVAGAAVLVWLGLWQVQRLAWKEGILTEIDTRMAETPGPVPALPDPARDRYRPVVVTGSFGDAALRVLVSRKTAGPGYLIVSPFKMQNGRRILVDRGFLRVNVPLSPPPDGVVTFSGNLHWPDDRTSATPDNDVAENIWFARDLSQMAEMLGTEPVLVVARALPGAAAVAPLPVDTGHIPNDHLEYAVTWFSLAGIWIVMTGFYIYRIGRRAEGTQA